ncbi:DUF805 domain-containing protein [Dehalococcoidia bacterium]|nr:DUF805 domain-containing protein [Dehalococcoidia bacterium]
MISFPSAIKMAYQRYAEFSGRSTRAEFWWFNLYLCGLTILLLVVGSVVLSVEIAFVLLVIMLTAHIIPFLSISVRRLHDTGQSGWKLLLNLVPFAYFIAKSANFRASDPGRNKYGPPSPGSSVGRATQDEACSSCGKSIEAGSSFCGSCGAQI